jgi:DNA helicase-2/ATP-dependent DNA helicase PcrA
LTDLKPLATALELIEQAPDSNPLDSAVITQSWPAEPVANRAKQRTAAELVQSLASKENAGEYELLLHELEKNRTITPPPLPTRLSASAFSALFSDPEGFSSRIARPTPVGFSEQADTGNKFHATLEAAFRAGDEVDFAGFVEDKPDAKELTAAYTDSRFANLKPEYAEIEIQFPLAGFVMVCKLDAVYKTAHGYEVVDWKTGAAPKSESDLATKSIQLALYRIALSKYLKIGLEKIEATFFFVGERKELKPAKLISESEIEKFLEQIRRDRLI